MTIETSISQYESLRVLLLGSNLGIVESPLRLDASTGPDFDALVSSASGIVRETLAEDVAFFRRAGVMPLQPVSASIYHLRTAKQHADNDASARFYFDWVGSPPVDWVAATARLVAELEDFFDELVNAALTVRSSSALTRRWVDEAAVSVQSIFDAVCRDLNISFRSGARAAKIRAIESRFGRDRPPGPKREAVAELCVQEVLSESNTLPVVHSELLDELGLLGSRDASAAVTLAYATARALPRLSGQEFSRKVSEMWWSLTGDR